MAVPNKFKKLLVALWIVLFLDDGQPRAGVVLGKAFEEGASEVFGASCARTMNPKGGSPILSRRKPFRPRTLK